MGFAFIFILKFLKNKIGIFYKTKKKYMFLLLFYQNYLYMKYDLLKNILKWFMNPICISIELNCISVVTISGNIIFSIVNFLLYGPESI